MNQNHATIGAGTFTAIAGLLQLLYPPAAPFVLALGGILHALKPVLPPKLGDAIE